MQNGNRDYTIAKLLRENDLSWKENSGEFSSLSRMKKEIESFLQLAPNTPAQCVEVADNNESVEGPIPSSDLYLEMNVVAGVLEEKPKIKPNGDTLLLPTEQTKEEFHHQKVQEAQAFMNLMNALDPQGSNRNEQRKLVEECEARSDDSCSVAVMDADELDQEDSSDDDRAVQRRRIEEI